MTTILIKRVDEARKRSDGFRILVDRLWPRGIRKDFLPADVWIKGIAPSPMLRLWFQQDPEKWETFRKSYLIELQCCDAVKELLEYCRFHDTITLVYAAKFKAYNHAVVLKQFLHELLETA